MQGRRVVLSGYILLLHIFQGIPDISQQKSGTMGADRQYIDTGEPATLTEAVNIMRGFMLLRLRWHEGTFYLITTNVAGGGNFIVTAKNPAGSMVRTLFFGRMPEGIDPSSIL